MVKCKRTLTASALYLRTLHKTLNQTEISTRRPDPRLDERKLDHQAIQDGPRGRHGGSVTPLLHRRSRNDDKNLVPVREDAQSQRPQVTAGQDCTWRSGRFSYCLALLPNAKSLHCSWPTIGGAFLPALPSRHLQTMN
jgi:hypothetical protein